MPWSPDHPKGMTRVHPTKIPCSEFQLSNQLFAYPRLHCFLSSQMAKAITVLTEIIIGVEMERDDRNGRIIFISDKKKAKSKKQKRRTS
jgi:hypothetical protein